MLTLYIRVFPPHTRTHACAHLHTGTLRPDLIESASELASGKADAIKTHHNDTQLVRELRAQGRVVEPLRDFHKDEVRVLGRDLGLSARLVQRHPFPGPGLAIRVLCAEEPYCERDFAETALMLKIITEFAAAVHTVRVDLVCVTCSIEKFSTFTPK